MDDNLVGLWTLFLLVALLLRPEVEDLSTRLAGDSFPGQRLPVFSEVPSIESEERGMLFAFIYLEATAFFL